MTCHVMAQEINVESLLKKADEAAKLADKYPKQRRFKADLCR